MTTTRDDIDRLQSILDAIEEMWFRLSDEDLPIDREIAKADGERGMAIVQDALKSEGQRRMSLARQAMVAAKAAREAAANAIPEDPDERRRLLQRIIANDTGRLPERLTMAFRDGKELTDAEIRSILLALAKLGVIESKEDS